MEQVNKCDVCGNPSQHQCGACHVVFYCSKEHQKTGWKKHKEHCMPFRIRKDDEKGYYLVATRAIREGELIVQELPLIRGPQHSAGAVCLSCFRDLDSSHFLKCGKCGWILCGSEQCKRNPSHEPECYYTAIRKADTSLGYFKHNYSLLDGILVLRCLYQKQFAPKVWEKLMKMKSGGEEIKKTKTYDAAKELLVKIIHHNFGLKDEFSEEEIMKVWEIFVVNQHQITINATFSVIYEVSSLFEHSCKANCYKTITSEGFSRMIAGVPIQKGDHLTLSYAYPLWTTPNRIRYLQQNKFFTCKCERCTDVTEFGSNYSSYKCQRENCKGALLPESFLTEDSEWICNTCGFKATASDAENVFKEVERDFSSINISTSKVYKAFLEEHKDWFHENSAHLINAKLPLIFMIGHTKEGGMEEVSNSDIILKMNLCHEVLEVMELIAPAEKKFRIDMLVQLQATLEEICSRLDCGMAIDPETAADMIKERTIILKETERLLKYEDKTVLEEEVCESTKLRLNIN